MAIIEIQGREHEMVLQFGGERFGFFAIQGAGHMPTANGHDTRWLSFNCMIFGEERGMVTQTTYQANAYGSTGQIGEPLDWRPAVWSPAKRRVPWRSMLSNWAWFSVVYITGLLIGVYAID